ncbi:MULTISPECIES: hypothetical protein [unclassified Calothrix]|nr:MULTISPECIES: hypothetical protein [unclassified Calothrix]
MPKNSIPLRCPELAEGWVEFFIRKTSVPREQVHKSKKAIPLTLM